MMKALYSTLVEICDSKKALAVVATLIAAGLARLHWDVSSDAILPYLGLVATYILGQGIADHGKSAAEARAANDNAPAAPKQAQAAFVRIGVMLAIAALGTGLLLGACGGPTPAPVADLINCIKFEGGKDWPTLEQQLKPDVDAHDWGKLVSDVEALGPKFGLEVASCVAVELMQQYLSAKQANGSATWGARDAVETLRGKLSGSGGKSVTFSTKFGHL